MPELCCVPNLKNIKGFILNSFYFKLYTPFFNSSIDKPQKQKHKPIQLNKPAE